MTFVKYTTSVVVLDLKLQYKSQVCVIIVVHTYLYRELQQLPEKGN